MSVGDNLGEIYDRNIEIFCFFVDWLIVKDIYEERRKVFIVVF